MSDTRRKVQPNWRPGNPDFDRWNDQRPEKKRVKSVKHQCRDRKPRGKEGGRFCRFTNHGKNSRWNLQRKNEQDNLQEERQ